MWTTLSVCVLFFVGGVPSLAFEPALHLAAEPLMQAPSQSAATAPVESTRLPPGARVATVTLPTVAAKSRRGKEALQKLQELGKKRAAEAAERSKAIDALRKSIESQRTVISEPALSELQKKLERAQVDAQRLGQDAERELQEFQQEVEREFQASVFPIVQKIAQDNGLHFVFSTSSAGFVWFAESVDLTTEVIKQLDAQVPNKSGVEQYQRPRNHKRQRNHN